MDHKTSEFIATESKAVISGSHGSEYEDTVFWVVAPCSLVEVPAGHTEQQPRRQSSSNESKAKKGEDEVVLESLKKRCKTNTKQETALCLKYRNSTILCIRGAATHLLLHNSLPF
jgi:hypothetical protein